MRAAALRVGEDDGVPMFLGAGRGPRYDLSLLLRVGIADETFLTRGITRLLCEVAIDVAGLQDMVTCDVGTTITRLSMSGDCDDVVLCLRRISEVLTDLPLDRFEHVRQTSAIRALTLPGPMTDGPDPSSLDLSLRFGAQTYGLGSFSELTVACTSPESLVAWRDRFCTIGNAAVTIVGDSPPPIGLTLPPGGRVGPPTVHGVAPIPSHVVYFGPELVGVSVLAAEGPAASVASHLPLHRFAGRISDTSTRFGSGRRVADLDGRCRVFDLAVELPGAPGAGLFDVWRAIVEDLAADGPTPSEVKRGISAERDGMLSSSDVDLVAAMATAELHGLVPTSLDERIEAVEAVTAEAARCALAAMLDSAIWRLADEMTDEQLEDPALGPDLMWWSAADPDGRVYRRVEPGIDEADGEDDHLVAIGDQSVSELYGDRAATVRFDCLAGYVRWSDGSRTVLGLDGTGIVVDGEDWLGGDRLIAALDAAVPPEVVFDAGIERPLLHG